MTTACRTTLGLVALGAAAVLGGCAARSARPDPEGRVADYAVQETHF
jgi:hypothetical protein